MSVWDRDQVLTASDGTRLRYRDSGGDGEPVLFVHGYTASIEGQWGKPGLIAGVRDKGWRTIAFDLRGHGQSDRPHAASAYAGDRMGRDAFDVLDHLGIARAHIVGYSLGAHIMLHTLVHAPERAATICLGGSAGRWNWTEAETAAVNEEADELEQGGITKHILRLWPANKPKPEGAELLALSDAKLKGMDARALAAIKRVMPDHQVSRAEVAALAIPMLGVVGTGDPQFEPFHELATFKPEMRLVVVEGAGHGDCPGKPAFLAALADFLTAHAGRTA